MVRNMMKLGLGKTLTELSLGITASSVTDDCFNYGIVAGCDEDCPTLNAGRCELQETDNKELYELALENQ
jgi:hypothetical protein